MVTNFAEMERMLIGERGRVGMVCTSSIATDDTTKYFFQDMIKMSSLVSLYDFENKEKLFPVVAPPFMFRLVTMADQKSDIASSDFVVFATNTAYWWHVNGCTALIFITDSLYLALTVRQSAPTAANFLCFRVAIHLS